MNSSYPVQACDYILNNIDLGKARFYNEYNYGSYMLFRGILFKYFHKKSCTPRKRYSFFM